MAEASGRNERIELDALTSALENTDVFYFQYNIKDRTIEVPEKICRKIGCARFYDNMPDSFAEENILERDRPPFFEMYGKINSGEPTASCVSRGIRGRSCFRTTLTVTKRGENGEPLEAVGIAEDVSQVRSDEEHYSMWLAALGEMYDFRCLIDVVNGTYSMLESSDDALVYSVPKGKFSDIVHRTAEKYVFEDDRAEYTGKLNCEYISFHIGRKNRSFSLEYRRLDEAQVYRWVRSTVIFVDALEDGTVSYAMLMTEMIDEEKEEMALLQSSLSMMRDTYYRIACIDVNRNSMRTITISDSEKSEIPMFRENYDKAIRSFAKSYVLEEYREKFLNLMLPERIKAIFDSGAEYVDITYRRLESGVPKWVRTELVPLGKYSRENRRVIWYVKNVSDEKALEDKLTQKLLQMNTEINLQLRTILDGISGGFKISLDEEGYPYYYISDSAAELFGYSMEEFTEVVKNSAIETIYPEDREAALASVLAQLKEDDSYSVKYRVKCRDGSIKWIVDSGKRVSGMDGKTMFYSLYQDVTLLEESNRELKNALTMIKQMLDSVNCGIIAYRMPDREKLAINDEAKRIFGCQDVPDDEIKLGELFEKRIAPEDLESISRRMKSFSSPGDIIPYDMRVMNEDGTMIRASATSAMMEFSDGGRYVLSTITDVTERSELYDILQEERMQFRDALLSNCEYAYTFDLTEGLITREFTTAHGVNIIRELGLTLPVSFDAMRQSWIERQKPVFLDGEYEANNTRAGLLARFEQGHRTSEMEYLSTATDIYVRVTTLMSKSKRNGHVMAVVVANDTTESRRKEEVAKKALEEAYEAAKRANAAKSDFLSRMSHDIRTPMNAIIGMTAIAGTHLDDRGRVIDCLDKINSSSAHLLSLINEVLDMSKIESGKIDLCEEEFNLSDLIDNLISMVRSDVKAKQLEFKIHISDIAHEKVIGDSLRIQQSFINLMSNSVKYTPEGGQIDLYISEKPTHSEKTGRYEFIFEDNGIGIEPEFLEHIFEPFARASDSRVSKIQGTGLGLAITENLVRMMNGTINVESELGKGTKFTVTISLKLQDSEEDSNERLVDLPVLVVDDDEVTCECTCHILEEIGMKGDWVLSGMEAVERVERHHIEENDYFAVIIDWQMPEMDGIETMREIRRRVGPDVPIIIISAYDWTEIEMEARAAGADAFISKPLFKSRLARLFHKMVYEEAENPKNEEQLPAANFPGKRVLLAEDNELNAEIAVELLEMMQIEVEVAENGRIAVDMFSASDSGHYDLVLMDIQMPVMNGNEATRAIRALDRRDAKGVPIIAMTANAFAEDVQAALSAGMNQHIAKPLDLKQFITTLDHWLG